VNWFERRVVCYSRYKKTSGLSKEPDAGFVIQLITII
jgi:hypothetical protein